MPYASARSPVIAANAVATSQPLASAAGLDILRQGGNAVDAAIAIAATLTVVEPVSNGLGSDAFALIHDGAKLHGLNASGPSPSAWTPNHFAQYKKMPQRGWDSVTVPGAVGAWVALANRFGKLPFAKLLAPAIHYASQGYPVSPITAQAWGGAVKDLGQFDDFRRDFMPNNRAPQTGEVFTSRHHAATLQSIADTNAESFYRGPIAKQIAQHASNTGGALTKQDLASYAPQWVDPISIDCHGHRLWEIPPNGQGAAALITLGILRHLNIDQYAPDSADAIHLQAEAMKIAFAQAHRFITDPAHMPVPINQLLNADWLRDRAAQIQLDAAAHPTPSIPPDHGTVYFTTADSTGMMVSMIQSNFMGFGSGIVVPNTGIALQNRGAGFTLDPTHPNCVGPNKKPYHTIIPGFVTRDDQPALSFGVMGGHMQPQGHVQMFLRTLVWNQNVQAASDAPRWHILEDFSLALEEGTDPATIADLKARGHRIKKNHPPGLFGGAQLIARQKNKTYIAASDHRKDGLAIGY